MITKYNFGKQHILLYLIFIRDRMTVILHSVHFSHSVMSNSVLPHGLQDARFPDISPVPRACSNSCPSNHLILCHPLLLLTSVFYAFLSSQFFALDDQSIRVSASASVLPVNIQDWFPLGWTCSLRDSQESTPTPQFKSINSSAFSFLCGPTLTSIHDYWKAIVSSHFIRVGTLTTKVSSNQKFSYHVRTQSWGSESGTQAYRQSTSLRLHIIQLLIWIKLFMNCQHHCQVVKAKNILSLNTKSTVYNE